MNRQDRRRRLDLRAIAFAAVTCGGLVACASEEASHGGETGGTTGNGSGGSNDGTGATPVAAGGEQGSTGGAAFAAGGTSAGTGGTHGASTVGASDGGAPPGGSSSGGASSGGSRGAAGSAGAANTKLPYSEDFEDGVANGWMDGFDDEMMPLGKWAVVTDADGKVYEEEDTTSDPSWAVGGDYRWTDQHLEAKVKFVSGAADALVMLVVRFTTFKTYCFVELRDNQMKLRVKVEGSTTDIGTYKFPTPLVDGTWYTVGVSAKGAALQVYFNGAQVVSGMNASVTAGGIALTATDGVVAFDDVMVTQP